MVRRARSIILNKFKITRKSAICVQIIYFWFIYLSNLLVPHKMLPIVINVVPIAQYKYLDNMLR